jgi:hypothetical protein
MFTWDCMAMLEHYETVSGAGEVYDIYPGQYGLPTSGPYTIYFSVNLCSSVVLHLNSAKIQTVNKSAGATQSWKKPVFFCCRLI